MPADLLTVATKSIMRSKSGAAAISLFDIQLLDGAQFFWSSFGGNFPSLLAGVQPYKPWVNAAGTLTLSRTIRTDSGNVTLQNISGNSIQRDLSYLARIHEFEGALVIFRRFKMLTQETTFQFNGQISEPHGDRQLFDFRMLAIFDPSDMDSTEGIYQAKCDLIYKGVRCGSASGLATCPLDFPSCVTRAAVERFNGIATAVPGPNIENPAGIGPGGGGGNGDNSGFGGGDRGGGIGGLRG